MGSDAAEGLDAWGQAGRAGAASQVIDCWGASLGRVLHSKMLQLANVLGWAETGIVDRCGLGINGLLFE